MPKGVFERTEQHKEQSRINGLKQKGKLPVNSKYKVGMKVGELTLIERLTPIGVNKRKIEWKCQCSCGNFVIRTTNHLSRKDCVLHCGCKKPKHSKNFKGYEDISGVKWDYIKRNAKLRNLEITVSLKDIWDLYLKQNKRCALSNLKIDFIKENSASLDRIDSTKGYIAGNIQWVHKNVNMMKRDLPEKLFIKYCTKIFFYNIISKIYKIKFCFTNKILMLYKILKLKNRK